MSLRLHAVIVQPDQWSGAPTELARLLAPITGTDVGPLSTALTRGPMTIEADLSASDAEALFRRLTTLGVPAEIEPPTAVAPPPRPRDRVTDEVPRKRSSTVVGHKPMVADAPAAPSGWGALFPDLADEADDAAVPGAPIPDAPPPSLDDLESAPPERVPSRKRVTTAPLSAAGPTLEPTAADAPDIGDFDFDFDDVEIVPPPPEPQPASPGPAGFNPTKLQGLLPQPEAGSPPYQPEGYDPRPEHHPPFATLFAVLAPGAGHVFNGDDDDAMRVATRFWLIVPWFKSIADSREQAEKIRDYWSPRPEDGSGFRAFRWVGGFWFIVGIAAFATSQLVPAVREIAEREEPATVAEVNAERLENGIRSAKTSILAARVSGLDAVTEAAKDLVVDQKFTLTEEERAERLFILAVPECRRRSYGMCEAMMKRVLQLKPAYSPAIRLQAWASLSKNGRRNEPMPDTGPIQTLNELELSKLRQEMALEGEEVPPPPEPEEEPSDEVPEEVPVPKEEVPNEP